MRTRLRTASFFLCAPLVLALLAGCDAKDVHLLASSGDTYVSAATPNKNFHHATELGVNTDAANGVQKVALMSFRPRDAAIAAANLGGAILRVHVTSVSGGTVPALQLFSYPNFDDKTITWTSRPAIGKYLTVSKPTASDSWLNFNVTDQVRAAMATSQNVAFAVMSPHLVDATVSSRESSKAPGLVVIEKNSGTTVTTSPATTTPTTSPATTTPTTSPATTTPTTVPTGGGAPKTPPALICGNDSVLTGPATPPAGAKTVPAGNNESFSPSANTTYWFAPGVHTLGTSQYSQIIAKTNDVFIGGPGAIIDGQGKNNFAFETQWTSDRSQADHNVTIEYLTIRNFNPPTTQSVLNVNSSDNWVIKNNTITHNESGAAIEGGNNEIITNNCISYNGQYAVNGYENNGVNNVDDNGPVGMVMDHNEFAFNDSDGYDQPGGPDCGGGGCSGGIKMWKAQHTKFTNNYLHDTKNVGFWADTDNVDTVLTGNYVSNNWDVGIFIETSYNTTIQNNTLIGNAKGKGPTNPGFPTGAIYVSESGGDARLSGPSTMDISHNVLTDNWSGVVLWESADRFCNSPANPSGCTLGGAATLAKCVQPGIASAPLYSDCRWKTQNVKVHDNTFNYNPANIAGCKGIDNGCGMNGLFSMWGSYPSWSPYMKDVIEQAVTFHQNNVFSHNAYKGGWHFMPMDQSHNLSPAQWQAGPYNQDAGSSFS